MKEVFLSNTGTALKAFDEEGEKILRSYPIGAAIKAQLTQPRRLPHHNFFFAFIEEVYNEWPWEAHPFPPDDKEHLRAWLTVKAGYRELFQWEFDTSLSPDEVGRSIKLCRALAFQFSGGRPIWFKQMGMRLYAAWPKSIKFSKMDEQEFKEFTTKVFDLIWAEVGIDVDDYYVRWQNKNGSLQVAPARSKEEADAKSAGLYFS